MGVKTRVDDAKNKALKNQGFTCNSGGERGRPKPAGKPRNVWLPILLPEPTHMATHNHPAAVLTVSDGRSAGDTGQDDAFSPLTPRRIP